jgi:heat shock protein HtpX
MNIYSAISANKAKTWLITVLFVVFITTIVYVFSKALGYSNLSFAGFALIFSGLISWGSYYYSDKLVLASVKAKKIEKSDNPALYRIVENLAIGDGLPLPTIYIINDEAPNAFATGRNPKNAVICVTTGLLQVLSKSELEGVISHELSHVKNYDIRLMSVIAILVGSVAIIADMFLRSMWFRGDDDNKNSNIQIIFIVLGIVFAIISPLVATIIQLAISRKREYLADASGALLTRYPEGLAGALEKISNYPKTLRSASNATAHMFIANPFKGKNNKRLFSSLFETHPPIEERVRILRSM